MSFVRNINRRRAISVGVLGGLLPFAALADNSVTLEDSIVTASQTAHSQLSVPASASVITRAELEKMPVYDLADAVKRLPGVHINTSSAYGRKEIKIRGMDSDYTLLLVNGRRINSRDALTSNYANDFDLSSIPMAAIERIEVIRGPMSTLYGSDAMGGVINIITRKVGKAWGGSLTLDHTFQENRDFGDTSNTSFYASGPLIDNLLGLQVRGSLYDRVKAAGARLLHRIGIFGFKTRQRAGRAADDTMQRWADLVLVDRHVVAGHAFGEDLFAGGRIARRIAGVADVRGQHGVDRDRVFAHAQRELHLIASSPAAVDRERLRWQLPGACDRHHGTGVSRAGGADTGERIDGRGQPC